MSYQRRPNVEHEAKRIVISRRTSPWHDGKEFAAVCKNIFLGSNAFFFVAQFPPQYLADIGLGQIIAKLNIFRALVSGELLLAVVHQLLDGQIRIPPDHEQLDGFAGIAIQHAYACAFAHARMCGDHILNFIRIHVKSRHQDHVLLAVDDFRIPAFVHETDISRFEESIRRHGFGGFFRTIPVPGHDLRAANGNFSNFPDWKHIALFIEYRDFSRWKRQTNGAVEFGYVSWITCSDRRSFRQAVTF